MAMERELRLPALRREVALTRDSRWRARSAAPDATDGDGDTEPDADDRIPIALSSETPVSRWFGDEILDHSAEAVDLSRAEDGLPLLLDHDTGEQIGVIEDVAVGDDRVLRGRMRFSRSARAQEIRQDVMDGIRTKASIGYRINEMTLVASGDDGEVYRATRWQPLEGSIVAVPADNSVGVGRGADEGALPVVVRSLVTTAPKAKEQPMAENASAPSGAQSTVQVTVDERARAREILALARQHQMEGKADGWIDSGRSVDSIAKEILDAKRGEEMEAVRKVQPGTVEVVDIPVAERKAYSIVRAIMAAADGDWSRAGYEREVAEETAKTFNKAWERNRVLLPTALHLAQGGVTGTRAGLDAKTSTTGQELKFTEPGSFIELLRRKMMVRALGATVISGLQGNVAFPKQTGAGTATWVAENPGADVADSTLTLAQVTISPKILQSSTSYSRNLLLQAVTDVEGLVRNDLALISALAMDLAGINGTGASNQPTGILNTSGIGSVTVGANGGVPIYDHFVDLETQLAAADADLGSMAYLTTPGVRGRMKKSAQISATTGIPAWFQGEVNGYPAEASNQVPATLTKGTATACHAIVFGRWSELLIGEWGAYEVIVDPYRLKKQGMIELTSYVSCDIAVRHAASFAAVKDALP